MLCGFIYICPKLSGKIFHRNLLNQLHFHKTAYKVIGLYLQRLLCSFLNLSHAMDIPYRCIYLDIVDSAIVWLLIRVSIKLSLLLIKHTKNALKNDIRLRVLMGINCCTDVTILKVNVYM